MKLPLLGKTAVVTGSSRGLGFEISKQLVMAGANVMMCARNLQVLTTAVNQVRSICLPEQSVGFCQVNVMEADDVKRLMQEAMLLTGSIQILVNNAGIYGPKGVLEETNWEDWVETIQVNLLGPVLTCRELLAHFKSQKYGKIIQVSGGGASSPLPRLSAYAVSKAAVVRLVETLSEEVKDQGIDVNAVAPGALNTKMLDEILDAGPEKVGAGFYEAAQKQKLHGGASIENAARLVVFLASPESDGITGRLISAAWDPWQSLAEHKNELKSMDIYTLRRIVPEDRGMKWH